MKCWKWVLELSSIFFWFVGNAVGSDTPLKYPTHARNLACFRKCRSCRKCWSDKCWKCVGSIRADVSDWSTDNVLYRTSNRCVADTILASHNHINHIQCVTFMWVYYPHRSWFCHFTKCNDAVAQLRWMKCLSIVIPTLQRLDIGSIQHLMTLWIYTYTDTILASHHMTFMWVYTPHRSWFWHITKCNDGGVEVCEWNEMG